MYTVGEFLAGSNTDNPDCFSGTRITHDGISLIRDGKLLRFIPTYKWLKISYGKIRKHKIAGRKIIRYKKPQWEPCL